MKVVTLDRSQFSLMNAISIEALIVIDVHAIDVIDVMIQEGVQDPSNFEWISQLRYYI